MDSKKCFLALASLLFVFSLSGRAMAAIDPGESSPPVALTTASTPVEGVVSAAASNVPAAMPAVPAAGVVSAPVSPPPPPETGFASAPAANAAPVSGKTAVATPVAAAPAAAPAAVVPVVSQGIPAAPTSGIVEAPPSAAELAIVQNATSLDTLMPPPNASTKGTGLRVTDILAQPANVRPWPERYLVVKKDSSAGEVDSRLTAARVALLRGHYQAALEIFSDLYKKDPTDIRVSMGRAVALQRLGQTDDALAAYESALSSDPKNVEALTNMLGLLKGQDTDTALEKLGQLREMYPANADVTAQLGMVYGVAGDYENALKYLDMADALKPGNSIVLYNKAVAYDRMGKTVEAASIYRQIVLLAGDGSLDQGFPIEAVKKRLAVMR